MKTAILATIVAIAAPVSAETYRGYETPQYSVVQKSGAFEVRNYDPALLAEVTVQAERSAALRQGFQILAGYIFGGNTSADKVAMTSPVGQSGDGDVWTVSFMMPHSYTRDTLPTPKDNAIRFVETEPTTQVVISFGGWATSGRLAKHEAALREFAQANALNITGPAQYLVYDDPLTVPWKRRNEVAFTID